MNFDDVKLIADAVLYEGYILYPYRASAIKNRQRVNFGALYAANNRSDDPTTMRTECIIVGKSPNVDVSVRFLQFVNREILELETPIEELPIDGKLDGRMVASLSVDGTPHQSWQEAVERDLIVSNLSLMDLRSNRHHNAFQFDASVTIEPIVRKEDGKCVAVIRRRQAQIDGVVTISSERLSDQAFKLIVVVENHSRASSQSECENTGIDLGQGCGHMDQAFASTHAILGVSGGEFVSLLDPTDAYAEAAASCQNIGVWPVLAGTEGTRDRMLASPIILYDYPQIAPESGGDFFDGTEMDEMLTLRVMTMTDDEKLEMRTVDERARRILDRTESISPDDMQALHGAVRGLRFVEDRAKE